MRRRFLFPHLALLAVLVIAAGCRDTAPTATRLSRVTGLGSITLDDYIQQQINLRLPKGFEDVVDARWSTVKSKKNAGDFAGAEKHLNTLATWIAKKQNDIIPADGHTKAEDAALLVLNMRRWLYVGENASIVNPSGPDDVVRFVPAGTAATVVTPSTHAGVSFGPQNEDRVIVIAEEQYPGLCNGPLPTARCQYPLFYQIESFPNTRLQGLGHFAVCMVTTGDRRPLDYLNDESEFDGHAPVHERLHLAHNKPANSADYTPGAIQEGGIEILPRSAVQQGFAHCEAEVDAFLPPMQKAMHAVLHFVERTLSPKSAFAYDQGPEHDGSIFSNFNGVDPQSKPDLSVDDIGPSSGVAGSSVAVTFTVNNTSRRSGGAATAASRATTATVSLSPSSGDVAALDAPITVNIPALAPDRSYDATVNVTLPTDAGAYDLTVSVADNSVFGEVSTENNSNTISFNVVGSFVGIWNGTISQNETEFSQPVTLIIDNQTGAVVGGDFRVSEPGGTVAYNDGDLRFFTNGAVAGGVLSFSLSHGTSGAEGYSAADFSLTRSGDQLSGPVTEYTGTGEGNQIRYWTMSLTKGDVAAISPPPSILVSNLTGLSAAGGGTAKTTTVRSFMRKP